MALDLFNTLDARLFWTVFSTVTAITYALAAAGLLWVYPIDWLRQMRPFRLTLEPSLNRRRAQQEDSKA